MRTEVLRTYPDSFWAGLYTSFPMFAEEIADRDLTGTTACVLGCSDGKFVIPLAAAGCTVTCVDVDSVMLDGGEVVYRGERTKVRGLIANLAASGLTGRCVIVSADYMSWHTDAVYDFVITSGSWAYNRNLGYGLVGVVERMRDLVGVGGYLFVDYLLPVTDAERVIDLYPQPADLNPFFPAPNWRIVRNDDVGLIGESHYGQEEWHYHNYGMLLTRRLA